MAKVITIGVVQIVTTTSVGTIKTLAGTTISYSDSTLPTRSINLTLGEYVIFAYDNPTTTSITPLTDIYDTGLTNANAVNDITAAQISRSLKINNACASNKGAEWVEKHNNSIPCAELLDDAETMVAMIDSVKGFVPENEIVSGKQATYLITATSAAGIKAVSLTIGTATYSFNSNTSTDNSFAADIALYINTKYPQNYPYYAIVSGANIVISGSTFATANGTVVSGSTTNGTLVFSSSATLAGGVAGVLQGENGITNVQIQSILNKLNKLCSKPCERIVNFAAALVPCGLLLETFAPLKLEDGAFALLEACVR